MSNMIHGPVPVNQGDRVEYIGNGFYPGDDQWYGSEGVVTRVLPAFLSIRWTDGPLKGQSFKTLLRTGSDGSSPINTVSRAPQAGGVPPWATPQGSGGGGPAAPIPPLAGQPIVGSGDDLGDLDDDDGGGGGGGGGGEGGEGEDGGGGGDGPNVYSPGDPVTIVDGPFAGQDGIVETASEPDANGNQQVTVIPAGAALGLARRGQSGRRGRRAEGPPFDRFAREVEAIRKRILAARDFNDLDLAAESVPLYVQGGSLLELASVSQ